MGAGQIQRLETASSTREAALVSRVLNRDRRAFHELYQGYRPRLTRFLTNLTHRPPLVEEVVNDTMMVVWERLDAFKGNSKLSTWVFAIAYRKGIKALQRSDDPVEDYENESNASQAPGPEESAGHQQTQRALKAALQQLSADHRAVVDLTYYHEMGYREIAEIMECPVDTVKTRMFHARRHLKAILVGDKSDWL
jgi:RNA polymerase sigma factor (sigma-70 family)